MKNSRPSFEKSKNFGQRLEQLVPGGAHTYSKGRDQFPLESPNGIVSGKGARVIDADGNSLVDWSMGLISVSLGHAYDEVDEGWRAIDCRPPRARFQEFESALRCWADSITVIDDLPVHTHDCDLLFDPTPGT